MIALIFRTVIIFQIFEKKTDKFGIFGKPRRRRIFKWKVFREKEELKLKKMKMQILFEIQAIRTSVLR